MKRVTLIRHESGGQGTFGKIMIGDRVFFTGELPWRDNQTNISCIPEGKFECRWTYSARFKRYMYEIKVPGRVGIRIHSANLMGDASKNFKCQLNGCISLGEKLGSIENQKAVLLSAPAVRHFESYMNHEPFELEIRNA